MANRSEHDAMRIEDTSEKDRTVDESRLDKNIHLNDVIQAEIDKDEKRVRKIIRKVDFRMVPILGLLYMWALIDRVNLPNIQIAGTSIPGCCPMYEKLKRLQEWAQNLKRRKATDTRLLL